jgi:hypothetical protein
MSIQDQLVAISARRSKPITHRGVTFHIRELTLAEGGEFRRRLAQDSAAGTAYLLQCTVCDENGTPALSEEAAIAIASGGAGLPTAIVDAVSQLADEDDLKKD